MPKVFLKLLVVFTLGFPLVGTFGSRYLESSQDLIEVGSGSDIAIVCPELIKSEASYTDELSKIKGQHTVDAKAALQNAGYTLLAPVGAGGFSASYIGVSPQNRGSKSESAPQVIKVLFDLKPANRWLLKKSQSYEAKINNLLHRYSSRFIPMRAKTFGFWNPLRVLEMPLIPEKPGSLKPAPTLQYLKAKSILPVEKQKKIRHQLRALLSQAHGFGIFHLDFKPENILISEDENGEPIVYLIDWGLSSSKKIGFSPYQLRENTISGTPGFISPERYGLNSITDYEDVFALRMTEWHLRATDRDLIVSLARRHVLKHRKTQNKSHAYWFNFYQPAVALDQKGTLAERIEAYAEWSGLPRTLPQREAFLKMAEQMLPKEFLMEVGKQIETLALSENPKMFFQGHRAAALEVLSSTVLIDHLMDLNLSQSTLDGIKKEAERMHKKVLKTLEKNTPSDLLDPAPELHFEKFFQALP